MSWVSGKFRRLTPLAARTLVFMRLSPYARHSTRCKIKIGSMMTDTQVQALNGLKGRATRDRNAGSIITTPGTLIFLQTGFSRVFLLLIWIFFILHRFPPILVSVRPVLVRFLTILVRFLTILVRSMVILVTCWTHPCQVYGCPIIQGSPKIVANMRQILPGLQ